MTAPQRCARFGIGHFDAKAHGYLVSRSRLVAHMLATYGRLPHGLAAK
jgi:hypothetical protein